MWGAITRTVPSLVSALFSLSSDYDHLERPVFTSLNFNVTPGYEPGELGSDNVEIMKNVERYVKLFFILQDVPNNLPI